MAQLSRYLLSVSEVIIAGTVLTMVDSTACAQIDLGTISGTIANERMGCAMAGSGTHWWVGASGATAFGISGGWVYRLSWTQAAGIANFAIPGSGPTPGSTVAPQFGASIAPLPSGGVIVGEPGYQSGGVITGRARLLGPNGAQVAVVLGRNGNQTAGTAVAAIGDFDGNNAEDCAVGQPHWGWVSCTWYSDWTGSVIVAPQAGLPAVPTATVDGCGGCPGFSACVDFLGAHPQTIAGLGNVAGDANPDFAVGVTNRNQVRIYGWTTTPTPGLVLHRTDTGPSGFGKAICSVGDINGNGSPDYAVGAPDVREVQVLEGSTGTVLRSWVGVVTGFGTSVALLGDQDGDGSPELLVGAPATGQDPGEVYVFSLNPNRNRMLALIEGRLPGGRMGTSVCGVPDQTGDGRDEIGVGAPEATVNGVANAGQAMLFSLDANNLTNGGQIGSGCIPSTLQGPEPRVGTPLGRPRLGFDFTFGVTHCQVSSFGILAMDLAALPPVDLCGVFPEMCGCFAHVAPTLLAAFVTGTQVAGLTAGLGYKPYTFFVPNDPTLIGTRVYGQAYVADPGLLFPWSVSKAAWAKI